jgi:hypothetical protein
MLLIFIESLILAQDERWRRALYMQVIRAVAPQTELSILQFSIFIKFSSHNFHLRVVSLGFDWKLEIEN